jgi:hypothetical protein
MLDHGTVELEIHHDHDKKTGRKPGMLWYAMVWYAATTQ